MFRAPAMANDESLDQLIPPPPQEGLTPASVHRGDFNGDDETDLLVFWHAARGGDPVNPTIYAGDGRGRLTPIDILDIDETAIRRAPSRILVADFNGDARDDVFMAAGADGQGEAMLMLLSGKDGKLRNQTAEALPDHAPWDDPSWRTWDAVMGDIDRDGDLDLMVGTQAHVPSFMDEETTVRLFVNSGDGIFFDASDALPRAVRQPGTHAAGVRRLAAMMLTDLDHDGADDLLVAYPKHDNNLLFMNAGFGDFTQSEPVTLTSAQFNEVREASLHSLPSKRAAIALPAALTAKPQAVRGDQPAP